jgi:hypothetical protein
MVGYTPDALQLETLNMQFWKKQRSWRGGLFQCCYWDVSAVVTLLPWRTCSMKLTRPCYLLGYLVLACGHVGLWVFGDTLFLN